MREVSSEEKKWHLQFAKSANQEVWKWLEKPRISLDEKQQLIHATHASCFHWSIAGGKVHQQRANWLLSRVYVVVDDAPQALKYAQVCLDLTKTYVREMQDFDLAYAYEAMARASFMNKRSGDGVRFLRQAKKMGDKIHQEEDKNIFFSDFKFRGLIK